MYVLYVACWLKIDWSRKNTSAVRALLFPTLPDGRKKIRNEVSMPAFVARGPRVLLARYVGYSYEESGIFFFRRLSTPKKQGLTIDCCLTKIITVYF